MMRYFLYIATGLSFCRVAYANVEGQYELQIEPLKQQVKQQWEQQIFAKIPKDAQDLWRKRLQQVLDTMSKMKTTMWFQHKGKFHSVAFAPGRPKSTSAGTWSRKGKLIEVKTTEVETKQNSTMLCSLQKQTMTCQSPGSPFSMMFTKQKK